VSRPRRRRAALSEDDKRLWRLVASTVEPLPGRLPPPPEPPPPAADPAQETPAAPPRRSSTVPVPEAKKKSLPLAGLETRLRQRVARGQLPIDARLDLHGLRQDSAHRKLFAFLLEAQRRGHKLVLVITGKGNAAAEKEPSLFGSERGVLRRLTPLWLAEPQARSLVVGFEEAALQHGGSGALYVRIRRVRE
jgi:DNA-nicking Smr family endonuclease